MTGEAAAPAPPKPRRTRAFIAAPCGWRAVFEEQNGTLAERPVACFVIIGQGIHTEARPMYSYAGGVHEVMSSDYRGLIGPGQTIEQMLAEDQAIAAWSVELAARRASPGRIEPGELVENG